MPSLKASNDVGIICKIWLILADLYILKSLDSKVTALPMTKLTACQKIISNMAQLKIPETGMGTCDQWQGAEIMLFHTHMKKKKNRMRNSNTRA